jgi:hypothetical protein
VSQARVTIGSGGVLTAKPDSLARDQLYVFGRINSSWDTVQEDFLGTSATLTADGLYHRVRLDEVTGTNGQVAPLSLAGISGAVRLSFTALTAIGHNMWFGTAGDLVTQRSLNPVFETRLQGTANADHRILAGFHNILNGAAYGADTNQSSEEVYFRKAAANTYWETVTRSTANATELVTPLNTTQCALGPCTTAAMRILRIELENTGVNGVARFYIDGALVATHNTNTVPAAVTRLGWSIGNGVSAAIAAPGRTVDIDYIRVWSDDPETQVQGATYTQSDTINESDAVRVITDGTEHMDLARLVLISNISF